MSFSSDISKYAKETNQKLDSAVREIVITLASEVNSRSPVGNRELWADNIHRMEKGLPLQPEGYIGGHFRLNNQYGFGNIPTAEIDGVDANGTIAFTNITAGVYSSPAAGVHYIVNNTPYAEKLENGHSTQAPQGIYGLSMMSVVAALR